MFLTSPYIFSLEWWWHGMAEMSAHCMQANTFKSKSSQWVAFTCLFAADEMHVAALTLYYWPSKHSSHSDQNSLIRLGFAVHVPFQLKVWKADLANLKNENKVIRLLWFLLHKSNHKKKSAVFYLHCMFKKLYGNKESLHSIQVHTTVPMHVSKGRFKRPIITII